MAQPDLRTDRLRPIRAMLRNYRENGFPQPSPVEELLATLRNEVQDLESRARALPRAQQTNAATIRRALCFLRCFGRIGILDFAAIPLEERAGLIELLELEYRWCFAAAGTTPRQFKVQIGRTGAR